MSAADAPGGRDWTDLAANLPGVGISHEATRRRQVEGPGADRSWRVGADGEAEIGALLADLAPVSRWGRLRGRAPAWRVLHSVPVGDGHGRERGDIDHVLIGPPGLVTINTKHHRTGRLDLHGEQLVLNGGCTDYVPKARREAERAARFLALALAGSDVDPDLARRLTVRPLIAIVGGRLVVREFAPGVTVVMPDRLLHAVGAFPPVLDPSEVNELFAIARRSTTWNPRSPRRGDLATLSRLGQRRHGAA